MEKLMPTRTKSKKNGGASPVPSILPREPLTRKALAAISEYATVKANKRDLHYHHFMVRWVLEAERMRRSGLYDWLEQRGYKWSARSRCWFKPAEKVKQ
jgi:hypothetical protein